MRLKPFDVIVNGILLLAVLALAVLCCGVAWGIFIPTMFAGFGELLTSGLLASILTTVAAVLLLILVLRILFVRKRKPVAEPVAQNPGILVRQGENGAAYITVDALQDVILRQVRANQKVRDCKCELAPGEGSAAVRIFISFAPDAIVPEVSTEVQTAVKENVEKMTGVRIDEVQMVVEKALQVSAIDRPRVG